MPKKQVNASKLHNQSQLVVSKLETNSNQVNLRISLKLFSGFSSTMKLFLALLMPIGAESREEALAEKPNCQNRRRKKTQHTYFPHSVALSWRILMQMDLAGKTENIKEFPSLFFYSSYTTYKSELEETLVVIWSQPLPTAGIPLSTIQSPWTASSMANQFE